MEGPTKIPSQLPYICNFHETFDISLYVHKFTISNNILWTKKGDV